MLYYIINILISLKAFVNKISSVLVNSINKTNKAFSYNNILDIILDLLDLYLTSKLN